MNNYDQVAKEAHQLRQANQEAYNRFNTEPTNGYKSRLEALWISELEGCEHFFCVECVLVPVWVDGPFGRFLSNYKPDLVILNQSGRILIELKPTRELALADDRQKRALELNPKYKFMVIGGYPFSQRGVTVRLLTGNREKVYDKINVCDVLGFLGCSCSD